MKKYTNPVFFQIFIRLVFFLLDSSQKYAGNVGVTSRREVRPPKNSHKTSLVVKCRALTFKLTPNLGRQQLAGFLFNMSLYIKNINIRMYTKGAASSPSPKATLREEPIDLSTIHSGLNTFEKIYLNPDSSRETLRKDLNNKSGIYL